VQLAAFIWIKYGSHASLSSLRYALVGLQSPSAYGHQGVEFHKKAKQAANRRCFFLTWRGRELAAQPNCAGDKQQQSVRASERHKNIIISVRMGLLPVFMYTLYD
jgi:hypothetical protein